MKLGFISCLAKLLTCIFLLSCSLSHAGCNTTISEPKVNNATITKMDFDATVHKGYRALKQKHYLTLIANCSSDEYFSISFVANATEDWVFQLGSEGGFTLNIKKALVDGQVIELGDMKEESKSKLSRFLRPQQRLIPKRNGMILQGKNLHLTIEVRTWFKESATDTRSRLNLESVGVFYIK